MRHGKGGCNLNLLSGLIKFSSVKFDFVVKGNPSHVVSFIGSFPQSFRGRDNIVQAFGFVIVQSLSAPDAYQADSEKDGSHLSLMKDLFSFCFLL